MSKAGTGSAVGAQGNEAGPGMARRLQFRSAASFRPPTTPYHAHMPWRAAYSYTSPSQPPWQLPAWPQSITFCGQHWAGRSVCVCVCGGGGGVSRPSTTPDVADNALAQACADLHAEVGGGPGAAALDVDAVGQRGGGGVGPAGAAVLRDVLITSGRQVVRPCAAGKPRAGGISCWRRRQGAAQQSAGKMRRSYRSRCASRSSWAGLRRTGTCAAGHSYCTWGGGAQDAGGLCQQAAADEAGQHLGQMGHPLPAAFWRQQCQGLLQGWIFTRGSGREGGGSHERAVGGRGGDCGSEAAGLGPSPS